MRPFTENPAVQQKFVEAGLQPLEQLAKAKQSLSNLSPESLSRMQATYARFPGWREAPGKLMALSQKFGAQGAVQQDIQPLFITPDTCSTNPDAEVPSNSDIAITKSFYIAAWAVMEGFPTDGLTFLARLPSIAAKAATEAAVLAVETLKAIDDDCTALDESILQGIITTAQTAIVTNANNTTTLLGNLTTAISNTQTAIVNNDNSNTTSIVNNDNANRTTTVNNDNTNTSAITTAIGGSTTTINNNSNANTSTITTAISSTQTTIINNSNAIRDELVNLALRQHIEEDLAQADNATVVALYVTPSSRGGYITLVQVVLLNARYAKSLVVGNKNDFNGAQAVFDAVTRPNKRGVAIKTVAQQGIQLVPNIRKGFVEKRTARVNQIRGLLSERGIIIPQGINQVRKQVPFILEDAENGLSDLSRELFAGQYEKLKALDSDIQKQDRRISRLCAQNERSQRFLEVPGIGPITATIAAADLGDGKGYASGRDYAASLGIVPKQHSSGGKRVYLGISKRGNRYMRT